MSLATAADARRIIALSNAEHEGLVAYLGALPPEGWTEQSAASEWKVYQAVSHIGSQPAIHGGMMRAGLRGEPPMTQEDRTAIWGRFDAMSPEEVFPAFRANNDAFIALVGSFGEAELGAMMPWLGGSDAPVASVLASRLNEQVLHVWDIKQARDKTVTLTAGAVPDLLDLNLTPGRLGGLVQAGRAPQLVGKTIQFLLSDPRVAVALKINETGAEATFGKAAADLTAELSCEGLVRLLWGRYDVAAALKSGELKLSDPSQADALQALLPGR